VLHPNRHLSANPRRRRRPPHTTSARAHSRALHFPISSVYCLAHNGTQIIGVGDQQNILILDAFSLSMNASSVSCIGAHLQWRCLCLRLRRRLGVAARFQRV
jgi:hypothetical protein